MLKWIDNFPWTIICIGAAFLGLAPFSPEPHLVEKIRMLFGGQLTRSVDIFDLFFHGAFPFLLLLKTIRHFSR